MEQIEAGSTLVQDFHSSVAVEIAFWIKAVDDPRWTLCIVSREINEKNFDHGIGEVLRITQEMRNSWIDPFQVRLLAMTDPLAAAALVERGKYARSPVAIRLGEGWFGDTAIEGAYIYPESVVAEPKPASVH